MRKFFNLVLASTALVGLFAAGTANASLIGDTATSALTNQLLGFSGTAVTTPFAASAVVGNGTEFNGQWVDAFSQAWDISVDLAATTLTVTAQVANQPNANIYAYDSQMFRIDLGSLNIGGAITGVNLTSGIGSFVTGYDGASKNVVTTAFTADSLALTWFNLPSETTSLPYGPKGVWTFDILHDGASTAEVPEPASIALLGLGLFGLAAMRRKLGKNKNA